MKKLLSLFALLPLVFASSACTIDHGKFTVLSTRLVDTQNFEMGSAQKLDHTEGKVQAFIILKYCIVGDVIFDVGGTLDGCFYDTDADVLTNANVSERWFWIPWIVGYYGVFADGDAMKTRKN